MRVGTATLPSEVKAAVLTALAGGDCRRVLAVFGVMSNEMRSDENMWRQLCMTIFRRSDAEVESQKGRRSWFEYFRDLCLQDYRTEKAGTRAPKQSRKRDDRDPPMRAIRLNFRRRR